jgi:cobalt-zinc-cadmium efflux system protein
LLANFASLRILGHGHGMNERGAYLHVMGDLLGSVAVIVAGVLMLLFNFGFLARYDPLLVLNLGLLVGFLAFKAVVNALGTAEAQTRLRPIREGASATGKPSQSVTTMKSASVVQPLVHPLCR